MSTILARLHVRETHGIRRFLYPLSTVVSTSALTRPVSDPAKLRLLTEDGTAIPLQVTPLNHNALRLHFAVFLAPYEQIELQLTESAEEANLNDPLQITRAGDSWTNQQQRFAITLGTQATIESVIYDGVSHLRAPLQITRNGRTAEMQLTETLSLDASLTARQLAEGDYPDDCPAGTLTEITACKSWATVIHHLEAPQVEDEIVFHLPIAVLGATLTCDFGMGGGIYAKLNAESANEVVWESRFGNTGRVLWGVLTNGRADFSGIIETQEEFLAQRWFHLIDRDKALAVAITQLPADCRTMTVRLTAEGDVTITFQLRDTSPSPLTFGVCYHFLNDIPAISAATNPQSILLVPTVEIL